MNTAGEMPKIPRAEKSKPFRLVKYFTITSLVVIFVGTLVLSMLNTHWAREMQQKKSEDYALAIVENLNHQLFIQFIVPVTLKYGRIQLRQQEQFNLMDKVVRSTLHSFKIERVNIYDKTNTVIYSYDLDLVGQQNTGGTSYFKAVNGQMVSKLFQRGNFIEMVLGIPKESRIITFAPLRAEKPLSHISGPVLGAVEIVQDLSDEYKSIFRFQILVVSTSALVMMILLLVLIFIVKKGEGIIEARAQERLRLKEQLSRAQHLSSIGEMVAGISHEIRNPLGIIRSSSELLKKKMFQVDPTNTVPHVIIEESRRLDNIITDFLNFAKPPTPNLTACRVEEVIEKNIQFLTPQLSASGHRIQKVSVDPLPEIWADAAMLYQAFLNLLINSIQATADGGTITIRMTTDAQKVVVAFEDEGCGIPDELMQRIWDPFFTTKEKGTGLGLGIVKKIIDAHGGQIDITRRNPHGTSVVVTFSIHKD